MRAAPNQVGSGAPRELSFAKKGLRSRDEASPAERAGRLWNLVGVDDVSGITAQDFGLFRPCFQKSAGITVSLQAFPAFPPMSPAFLSHRTGPPALSSSRI